MDFTAMPAHSFFEVDDISLKEIEAHVQRDYASEDFNLDALWKSSEGEHKRKKKREQDEDDDEEGVHALLFDCADESVEKFWNVTEDVFMNKMERVKKPSHSSSPGLASDVSSDENESSRLFLDRLETLAKEDEDAKALFFLDAPMAEDVAEEKGFDIAYETMCVDGGKNVIVDKFAESVRGRAREVLLFELERAGFLAAKKKTNEIPTSPTRTPKKSSSSMQPHPWDNLSFAIDRIRELQKSVCMSRSLNGIKSFDKKINIVSDNICASLRDLDNIETRQLNRAKKAMKMTLSVPDGRVLRVIQDKFKHSRKVALVAFEKFCAKAMCALEQTRDDDDDDNDDDQENDKKLVNTPTRDKTHLPSDGDACRFNANENENDEEKSKRHGKLVKKILSEWLYENFYPTETRKRPIPTKAEKRMLAKKTGLTQTQVTDWFVNARARLWKPRVEGIVRSVVDELKNKRNVNTSTPVVV